MRTSYGAMKAGRARSSAAVLCIVAACALFPTEARADAINFGYVAVAGVIILVPLTLFTVLVEGIVLAVGLRLPYRRTLAALLAANLASLAAGIPVKIFNAWMYSELLPRPLAAYFRLYPYVVCLGSIVFFLITLATEYLVLACWRRRRAIGASRRRLAAVVLMANAITYAVLAPIHYAVTRPIHDVREFTDDAAWAQRPVTELFFISGAGSLCSVTTDGQNVHTLVPDVVRDYQYVPAQLAFLYRNGSNALCLFRQSRGNPVVCWQTDERFRMEQVACSPDGRIVAYLSRVGELKPYELILFDSGTARRVRSGIFTEANDFEPEIAWSEGASTLLLKSGRTVRAISIGDDLKATVAEHALGSIPLAEVYGRFSSGHWWGGEDWGASLSNDKNESIEAYALPGLGSHLRITKAGTSFVVAENPGLLKLGNRGFNDVCLLDNGNELVFDDYNDIYLLNIDDRRVGRIVQGSRFITLSARYLRKAWDGNK